MNLGLELYKNKLKFYRDKFKNTNKKTSQINFLGSPELWATLSTLKQTNDKTQKTIIEEAVREHVKIHYPDIFKDYGILKDEEKESN